MITKLYKVYADYCGPCKQLSKELEGINVPIEPINAEENDDFTLNYNIRGIPVLIFMDGDKEIYRHVGLMTHKDIQSKIDELNEIS